MADHDKLNEALEEIGRMTLHIRALEKLLEVKERQAAVDNLRICAASDRQVYWQDRAEKAEAERDALVRAAGEMVELRKAADALADVVGHQSYCPMSRGTRSCTCGLDAALAAYRAAKGGE